MKTQGMDKETGKEAMKIVQAVELKFRFMDRSELERVKTSQRRHFQDVGTSWTWEIGAEER